jgi:hypothetical protein
MNEDQARRFIVFDQVERSKSWLELLDRQAAGVFNLTAWP